MGASDLDVLYLKAGGPGWGPIDALAELAATVLDGNLVTVLDRGGATSVQRAAALLPRRRVGHRRMLVIAANPSLLAYTARRDFWIPGYQSVAGFVIDSFWTDRISRFAKRGGHFDRLFITDADLVDDWERQTKVPTSWLPWGTDTLAAGEVGGARPVDLLRVGRQPSAWDDDEASIQAGASRALAVAGRPPMGSTGIQNQRILRDALRQAKHVLAFHNLVSPSSYTHPTRSYLTGRWTDALAAGATVVGAAPANAKDVLWPGATYEIDPKDVTAGFKVLQELVQSWSVDKALRQHRMARERLDWRLRLEQVRSLMGWPEAPLLKAELTMLASPTGAGS